MSTELQLEKYVKQVFVKEKDREDKFLTEDDLLEVLDEKHAATGQVRQSVTGYPSHPLYKQLACMLQIWMETKHCPVLDLPIYDLLDEKVYTESSQGKLMPHKSFRQTVQTKMRQLLQELSHLGLHCFQKAFKVICMRAAVIQSIAPVLEGLKTLHTLWGEEEIQFRIREILVLLGKRGLLDLLGIRKTEGTKELWPPSRSLLIKSFSEPHSPRAELWVGARALAKHFHRDQTESWWGNCSGSEKQKNEHALQLVNKILDSATWINIHWLPQDVYVIEARCPEGYGARWTADGKQFRGFLEPQMVDGHEVGWRH